jgi:CHAT domain-containing protein/tetratricopeptide (TPR) repeat protein
MTPRLPIAILAASIALLRASAQDDAPASRGYRIKATVAQCAANVLEAFQRHDDAEIRKIALAMRPDQFLIADVLFQGHVRAARESAPETRPYLEAAAALAEAAKDAGATKQLAAFVAAWAARAREDLAGVRRFNLEMHTLLGEVRGDEWEDAVAKIAALDLDSADARVSVTAACVSYEIAERLREAHRMDDAERAYRRNVTILRAMGWRVMELFARHGVAQSLAARGENRRAAEAMMETFPVMAEAGDSFGTAGNYANLAGVLVEQGEYDQARELLDKSFAAFTRLGDGGSSIAALNILGGLQAAVGQYALALESWDQCRRAFEGWKDVDGLSDVLSNIGEVQVRRGDFAEALATFDRVLGQLKAGDAKRRARVFSSLGALHLALRMPDLASESFEKAREEFETAGNLSEVDRVDGRLASIWIDRGDYVKARGILTAALEREERRGNDRNATVLRGLLVEVHRGLGEEAQALAGMNAILALVEKRGDRAGIATARRVLGEMHAHGGDFARAVELLGAARRLAADLSDRTEECHALTSLAAVHLRAKRFKEALAAAREALAVHVTLEGALPEQNSLGLRDAGRDVCRIGLLAARAQTGEGREREQAASDALEFMELGRARLLAREIVNRDVVRSRALSPVLADEEARARINVATLQARLVRLAGDAAAAERDTLHKDLDAAYRRLVEIGARAERESRGSADIVFPRFDLAAIKRSLPAGTAFVSFQLDGSDQASGAGLPPPAATAVVVTAAGTALVDLGDPAAIARDARTWLKLARAQAPDEARLAASLYDALVRPIEPHLGNATRVVVSPDGDTALLPIEALIRRSGDAQQRLIERLEVCYAPSGTVNAALVESGASRSPGDALLAFGDPVYPGESRADSAPVVAMSGRLRGTGSLQRLPGTGDEVRALSALFPKERQTLRLRAEASRAALLRDLAAADASRFAIHLACHGIVDTERPRLSGLVLSDGEVLTLDAIYGLRIRADLVVLSACDTGQGSLRRGEGMIGLARGFLAAGAPRVVVSNWKVEDRSTQDLMIAFYEAMRKSSRSPGDALRSVKLARLAAGGARAHPFHWAPFVLWGVW